MVVTPDMEQDSLSYVTLRVSSKQVSSISEVFLSLMPLLIHGMLTFPSSSLCL